MKRIYVDAHQIQTIRLFLRDFNIWHIVGAQSISVPSLGAKIVLRSVCKPWLDLNGETVLMTPGEAARTELNRAFPDLKRVGWPGPMVKLFSRQVPLYFTGPVKRGELYYVDITGAYCQIYAGLWLDVCYPKGRGFFPLQNVATSLADWKQARNSVVGVCRSRSATGQKGSRVQRLATTNKFLSPGLWATVTDVLQSFASIAVQSGGCVYYNTDGAIFTDEHSFDFFTACLGAWGIAYHTERGPGEIRGWGNYEVGGKRAGRADAPPVAQFAKISTLSPAFPGTLDWWLRQRERIR